MQALDGYQFCICGCGRQELAYVSHQTGGLAFDCFRDGRITRLEQIETIHRGAKVSLPNPNRKKHGGSKGSSRTRQKTKHAQTRAMRRLKNLYPEVFAVLYADERSKLGLPCPANPQKGYLDLAVQTVVGPNAYDAAPKEPGQ